MYYTFNEIGSMISDTSKKDHKAHDLKVSYTEVFKKFIRSNFSSNQINEFLICLKNDKTNGADVLTSYCYSKSPTLYIYEAFNWTISPSGHDFWARAHKEWQIVFNNRNKIENKQQCKSIW